MILSRSSSVLFFFALVFFLVSLLVLQSCRDRTGLVPHEFHAESCMFQDASVLQGKLGLIYSKLFSSRFDYYWEIVSVCCGKGASNDGEQIEDHEFLGMIFRSNGGTRSGYCCDRDRRVFGAFWMFSSDGREFKVQWRDRTTIYEVVDLDSKFLILVDSQEDGSSIYITLERKGISETDKRDPDMHWLFCQAFKAQIENLQSEIFGLEARVRVDSAAGSSIDVERLLAIKRFEMERKVDSLRAHDEKFRDEVERGRRTKCKLRAAVKIDSVPVPPGSLPTRTNKGEGIVVSLKESFAGLAWRGRSKVLGGGEEKIPMFYSFDKHGVMWHTEVHGEGQDIRRVRFNGSGGYLRLYSVNLRRCVFTLTDAPLGGEYDKEKHHLLRAFFGSRSCSKDRSGEIVFEKGFDFFTEEESGSSEVFPRSSFFIDEVDGDPEASFIKRYFPW